MDVICSVDSNHLIFMYTHMCTKHTMDRSCVCSSEGILPEKLVRLSRDLEFCGDLPAPRLTHYVICVIPTEPYQIYIYAKMKWSDNFTTILLLAKPVSI